MKISRSMSEIVVIAITFLYLYNIKFVNIPATSRQVMAVLAVLFLLPMMDRSSFARMRWFVILICIGFSIMMVSVMSSCYNGADIIGSFFNIPLSLLSNSLACMFILKIGWTSVYWRYCGIDVFVYCVFTHNVLVVLLYMSSGFKSALYSIVEVGFNSLTGIGVESSIFSYRLLGIGEGAFFSGGVISSYGLLCSTYMIFSRGKGRVRVGYIGFFLVILMTGIFISRTTYLGLLLSALFALVNLRELKLTSWMSVAVTASIPGFCCSILHVNKS